MRSRTAGAGNSVKPPTAHPLKRAGAASRRPGRARPSATRGRIHAIGAGVAQQLVDTMSGPLGRRAVRDRDDTQTIGRVEIREKGLTAATLPPSDDSHIEAGVAAWPFPDHRPPSFKGRRWPVHRPHATAWASAARRPPASAGRKSAWLDTPIWPACRAASSQAPARKEVVTASTTPRKAGSPASGDFNRPPSGQEQAPKRRRLLGLRPSTVAGVWLLRRSARPLS